VVAAAEFASRLRLTAFHTAQTSVR